MVVDEPWESVRECWLKSLEVGMIVRVEGDGRVLEIVKIEDDSKNIMDGIVTYKEIFPTKRRKVQNSRFWWIYRETRIEKE